jgi:hypothetical protein
LIAIGLAGCSKEDLSKSPYLGERLMSLVDTIESPPPAPNVLNSLIKECDFKEGSASRHASNCQFTNIAPKRQRAVESSIAIDAITPNCCTTAVYISQGQLDQQGGLDLFANLSGVKKKELKCPKIQANNTPMDGSDFFEIVKDGKTKFFIREDYNRGGNGGQSTYTTVFFGKPKAMYAPDKIVEGCDYFAYMQDDFYAARRGESPNKKQAGISSCADGKTATEISRCLANSPERVNKYENLNFYTIHPDEDKYLDEFLAVGDDCNKLIKATKRRNTTGMVVWTQSGNDGLKKVTTYASDSCGDGADNMSGRTPRDICSKFNNAPYKDNPSKLFFTDDSLDNGVQISQYKQGCTAFESLKKIQGIHYQSTHIAQESCYNKKDLLEVSVSEKVNKREVRNVLVCSK